jgi:exodeoxyribonuclease VII large subunit
VVARHRVERAGDRLSNAAASVARRAPGVVERADAWTARHAGRLVPLLERHLDEATASLGARRALLAAYDPARLLARGWSITTDDAGRIVRSVDGLVVGSALATRVADGVARSSVTNVDRA